MKKQCENVDPLPAGWLEDLHAKADLEHAFALLRPVHHFYAEAWKGRLRSFQLRWDTAYKHFHKAHKLAADAGESLPRIVHEFYLNLWSHDNALIANLPDDDSEPEPDEDWSGPDEDWSEPFPEKALDEYPELRAVQILGRKSDALSHLHRGEHGDAAAIYQELLENRHAALHVPGEIPFFHLGLAACEQNLGFPERTLRSLENAGLTVLAGTQALSRLHAASVLHALYKMLEKPEEARSWKAFIEHLDVPDATKRVFLERSDLIVERSTAAKALLIL